MIFSCTVLSHNIVAYILNICIKEFRHMLCHLKSADCFMNISTHELLNQQQEIHCTRTVPIADSMEFLLRGFNQ